MMNVAMLIALIYQHALEVTAAVLGLVTMRRTWPFCFRLLVYCCCFIALSELISFALAIFDHYAAKFYNVYVSIETMILTYILFCETTLSWSRRLLKTLLIVLSIGLLAAFAFTSQGLGTLNLYSDTLQLLVLVIGSCALLVDMLHDMSGTSLYKRPAFWFSLAMLVSSSVFLLIEAALQYVKNHHGTRLFFMPFNVVANTFMYGGIVKCFLALKKQGTCLSK